MKSSPFATKLPSAPSAGNIKGDCGTVTRGITTHKLTMTQVIQTKSIYHGLPEFPQDINGLTAIVTGSNGISGAHQLKVLCENPRRWRKIYALSRRPPYGSWPDHVEHIPVDLLQSPEMIAAQLVDRGVHADYVFFFAYIQPTPREGEGIWSAADEMVTVNSK